MSDAVPCLASILGFLDLPSVCRCWQVSKHWSVTVLPKNFVLKVRSDLAASLLTTSSRLRSVSRIFLKLGVCFSTVVFKDLRITHMYNSTWRTASLVNYACLEELEVQEVWSRSTHQHDLNIAQMTRLKRIVLNFIYCRWMFDPEAMAPQTTFPNLCKDLVHIPPSVIDVRIHPLCPGEYSFGEEQRMLKYLACSFKTASTCPTDCFKMLEHMCLYSSSGYNEDEFVGDLCGLLPQRLRCVKVCYFETPCNEDFSDIGKVLSRADQAQLAFRRSGIVGIATLLSQFTKCTDALRVSYQNCGYWKGSAGGLHLCTLRKLRLDAPSVPEEIYMLPCLEELYLDIDEGATVKMCFPNRLKQLTIRGQHIFLDISEGCSRIDCLRIWPGITTCDNHETARTLVANRFVKQVFFVDNPIPTYEI